MSQCTADWLTLPVSGYPAPTAMWMVPPIFSSNRMLRMKRSIPKFVPNANSPIRRAPASVSSVFTRYASFRAALALRDAPTIRYNLASVLFEQGEYPEASAQIETVLADANAPADLRAHVTTLRTQLHERAGFARVELVGMPEAAVAVDGFRLADVRLELPLAPGPHLAIATRGDAELARSALQIQTGQHATFTLGAPVPEPAAPTPEPALVADADTQPLVEQWWFWTAVGGGVVLSAVLIGVAASSGGVEEPIPGNFQPGVVRW